MKKSKGLFLSGFLFLGILSGCSSVANGTKTYSYEYTYAEVDGGVEITGIKFNQKNKHLDITIPSQYLGKKVVSIAENAFKNVDTIYTVVMSPDLQVIKNEAFSECDHLTNVFFPNSAEVVIKERVFAKSGLTTLNLPSKLQLENETFKDCESLRQVTSNLNVYGRDIFSGCSNLQSLTLNFIGANVDDLQPLSYLFNTIPESLTHLVIQSQSTFTADVFDNCTNIKSIELPSPAIIQELPKGIFEPCTSLETIKVPFVGKATYFDDTPVSNDYSLAYLFNKENNSEVPQNLKTVQLHATAIPKNDAVRHGMISIRKIHFSGCQYLEAIQMDRGDRGFLSIEENAFEGCSSLNSINFPSSLEKIGSNAFNETKLYDNLKEGQLLVINNWAIAYKNNPEASGVVTVNSSATGMIDELFKNNTTINTVTMNAMKQIGSLAFQNASNLTSVRMDVLTEIPDATFENCTSLVTANIPRATEIGKNAFKNANLLQEYRSRATVIKESAFEECRSLTAISFSQNATTIEQNAFKNCVSLSNIKITNKIVTLGLNAFEACDALTIYCEADAKPAGWDNDWNPNDRPVYWGINDENYLEKDGLIYVIIDNQAVVTGHTNELKENVVIPSTVKINNHSYDVTSIGKSAFGYCKTLKTIILPNSIATIAPSAFEACDALTIYCEADAKPAGWDNDWNPNNQTVYWNNEWSENEDGIPAPVTNS